MNASVAVESRQVEAIACCSGVARSTKVLDDARWTSFPSTKSVSSPRSMRSATSRAVTFAEVFAEVELTNLVMVAMGRYWGGGGVLAAGVDLAAAALEARLGEIGRAHV